MDVLIGLAVAALKAGVSEVVGIEFVQAVANQGIDIGSDKLGQYLEKSQKELSQILTVKSLRKMNVPEGYIAYIKEEIKEMLQSISLEDDLFRNCRYDAKSLARVLYEKYKGQKTDFVEYEDEIQKILYVMSEKAISLEKERNGFAEDSLIYLMRSVDDQVELFRKIFSILNEATKTKMENLDQNGKVEQGGVQVLKKSFSERRLNEARISYNKKAKEYYSYIKTLLHNRKPVLFSKIYTRMFLTDSENRFIKTNDINKITKLCGKKILITGAAGMGKSLMLRYMFIKVLKIHEQIPVLLFLRNLVFNQESLKNPDFLCKQIYDHMQTLGFDITWDVFKSSLSTLDYVVLLDGFDEVEYEYRKKLEFLINEFCKRYPHIILVVSSRPESSFVSWNGFCELEIRPLTKKLIKIVIERSGLNSNDASNVNEEIIKVFQKKLPYAEFLRTPLLLTILCVTYKQFGELPDRVSTFYEQAFSALYSGQDRTKTGFVRSLESGLSFSDFKNLIEYICFKSYFNNEFSFSEKKLINYIQLAANKGIVNKNFINTDSLFSDMVDGVGIFVRDGVNYILVHRSFQEYFAAIYLANNMSDEIQVKFFSSWLRKKRIIDTNLLLDILYDYNPDRFIQNVLLPGIEELKDKYEKTGESQEKLIRLLVKEIYIRNHKSLNLKYVVVTMNDMYYNHMILRTCRIGMHGSIYSNRSARVLGLNNEKLVEVAERQKAFVSKLEILYDYNKRISIDQLKRNGIYQEFLESCYWIIERYDFSVRFIEAFKQRKLYDQELFQAILDAF